MIQISLVNSSKMLNSVIFLGAFSFFTATTVCFDKMDPLNTNEKLPSPNGAPNSKSSYSILLPLKWTIEISGATFNSATGVPIGYCF